MADYQPATMSRSAHKIFIGYLLCGLLLACDSGGPENTAESDAITGGESGPIALGAEEIDIVARISAAYFRRIDSDFNAAGIALEAFAGEVESFLADPDEPGLTRVRKAWINASVAYELTNLHRYFASSVLIDSQSLNLFQLDYQISHWPILPGYIDYVSNYPDSGMVNDMTVALEPDNLRAQHGAFDINEAALGLHVIEYLLWGENNGEGTLRPASDFRAQTSLTTQQINDGLSIENLSSNRRREFLSLLTALLLEDFANLVSTWSEGSSRLRVAEPEDAAQSLQHLLTAMTGFMRDEVLTRSLYLMLNGEFAESRPSIFSDTSQNMVSAQLTAMELLLLEIGQSGGGNMDQLLSGLSADYEEFFLQNFDASKECLVVLYSEASQESMSDSEIEFKVVECINALTNMIDYLERIGTNQA